MTKTYARKTKWKVTNRPNGVQWEGELVAYWEVDMDPISDKYTPEEISADDLLEEWAELVQADHPDGMIPIYWFAVSHDARRLSRMPFQINDTPELKVEHFLTEFSWPVNAETWERLNWLMLPVEDKLWNAKRADKGGFIQQATGWKPAILQPYVFLPSLMYGPG
jgi:hypothetical protein